MEENLVTLFRHWSEGENELVKISLLNKEHIPVGMINPYVVDMDKLTICVNSRVSEKYYLYCNGVGIFFSYYEKVNKDTAE